MRDSMRYLALAGICTVCVTAVPGQEPEGTLKGRSYLGLDIGVALQSEAEVKTIGGAGVSGVDLEFDPGVRLDLGMGRYVTERLSAGLSLGVVINSLDKVSGPAPAGFLDDLEFLQVPLMGQLMYRVQSELPIEPFLGVGLGGILNVASHQAGSDSEFTFGYQGVVGLTYRISNSTAFSAMYKLLGTTSRKFDTFEIGSNLTHTFAVGLSHSY